MYEVFLSTFVDDEDFQSACSVLGGLCAMPPWESLHRVLYFKGPPRPTGIPNQSSVVKAQQRKEVQLQWKELHQQLTRQSYLLQARYEVYKDKDFGVPSADFNGQQGILRWTDFPDPPGVRAIATQRKKSEIWEQRNLPAIMKDNKYLYKCEAIERTYQFFRDEVEFCLSRHYPLPVEASNAPLSSLPSWDSLTPADPAKRWMFLVKVHVLQDNTPNEILKAHDQLAGIKKELDGVFDFRVFDRRVHDTRIAVEVKNTPVPLPQMITLGNQR